MGLCEFFLFFLSLYLSVFGIIFCVFFLFFFCSFLPPIPSPFWCCLTVGLTNSTPRFGLGGVAAAILPLPLEQFLRLLGSSWTLLIFAGVVVRLFLCPFFIIIH